MKRLIIAGLMLAAAIACSKQNPESTYLVDPGKADPVADFEYEIDREAGIVHFKNTFIFNIKVLGKLCLHQL